MERTDAIASGPSILTVAIAYVSIRRTGANANSCTARLHLGKKGWAWCAWLLPRWRHAQI